MGSSSFPKDWQLCKYDHFMNLFPPDKWSFICSRRTAELPFCCFFAWPCLSCVCMSCEVNVKHLQCESPNSHTHRVFSSSPVLCHLLSFPQDMSLSLSWTKEEEEEEKEIVEKINCPICQNIWFSLWSNLPVVINWFKIYFLDFSNYKFGFYYFQLDIFTFD